jgi:hypothetical protein
VNPHWYQCGQGFRAWWPEILQVKKKPVLIDQKLLVFFIQVPGEAFSPQKRTPSTSKHEFSSLFQFLGAIFLSSWIWTRIQPTKINADPDRQHWFRQKIRVPGFLLCAGP